MSGCDGLSSDGWVSMSGMWVTDGIHIAEDHEPAPGEMPYHKTISRPMHWIHIWMPSCFIPIVATMLSKQEWVVKRARGGDSNPIGLHHKNPLFDTRAYTVELPNFMVMKEICDHQKDGMAIPIYWMGLPPVKMGTRYPSKRRLNGNCWWNGKTAAQTGLISRIGKNPTQLKWQNMPLPSKNVERTHF